MKILGIETSCDETAAAIVSDGKTILSNVVASSQKLHNKTGGVIPEIAAREQIRCIMPVIHEAMQNAKCDMQNLDAIAVTVGPGLIGSLLVGVETAKTIAFIYQKPIIPVNHIFAHIYANWLFTPGRSPSGHLPGAPSLPAIALVVSGGHTELFFMKNNREIQWIGGTLDDASGEAFDKTARLLGLGGYPGGPAIAAKAAQYSRREVGIHDAAISHSSKAASGQNSKVTIKLPRPMINSNDLNFSFSGLKTAVLREVNKLKEVKPFVNTAGKQFDNETVAHIAWEVQEAITDVLVKKTLDAVNKYRVKSILLGGGVAANKRLTEKMKLEIKNLKLEISLHIPPPRLCADNGAIIASFAYFHNHPIPWKNVAAQPDMDVEVGIS